MSARRWVRIALGYLFVLSVEIGVWALMAPRSFYDGFPGLGRAWVSVDGPFNEHLVRDVGALSLAFAALLVAAAVRLTPDLVVTAGVATLLWGGPHAVYHVFHRDGLDAVDLTLSLGGLALFVILGVALVLFGRSDRLAGAAT